MKALRLAILFTSTCGTTTLSRPDPQIGPGQLDSLTHLPRDQGEPVFAEPWQAQAFALAMKLSEQDHFSWKEWSAALARELQNSADRSEPDDGSRYYDHWPAALEHMVTSKALTDLGYSAQTKGSLG